MDYCHLQKSPSTRHPALARIFDMRRVGSSRDGDEGSPSGDVNALGPTLANPAKTLWTSLQAAETAHPLHSLSGGTGQGKKRSAKAAHCGEDAKQAASPVGHSPGTRRSKRRSTTRDFTRNANGEFVSLTKQTPQPKHGSQKEAGSGLKSSKRKEPARSSAQHCRTALDFSKVEAVSADTPAKLTPAARYPQVEVIHGGIASGSSQKVRTAKELHQAGPPQLTSPPEAAKKAKVKENDQARPSSSTRGVSRVKQSSQVHTALGVSHAGPQRLEPKLAAAKAKPTIKAEPQVVPLLLFCKKTQQYFPGS